MYLDGVATFKTISDILKLKQILDSWLQINPHISEKIYTDGLQRMLPSYKHQPFVYSSAIDNPEMVLQPHQPTYYNVSPRYHTVQKKKPKN